MSATHALPLLQQARIASPCSMRWEDMTPTGASHTRRCEQCNLNVHNFAEMTGEQAEAILQAALNPDGSSKHRVCAGIYRRADGTVLTADCPVGLAAVRAKVRRIVVRSAAAIGLTALVAWVAARESGRFAFARVQPLTAITNYLRGVPVAPLPAAALTPAATYGDMMFGQVRSKHTRSVFLDPPEPMDAPDQPAPAEPPASETFNWSPTFLGAKE